MNILILNGSPRKKGNTSYLLNEIINGIKSTGETAELINLADLQIHPCIACGHCEKKGICIFDDDMSELYKKCSLVDALVIASPIYFYSVTAQTKLFIDRCQVFWSNKYILKNIPPSASEKRGYFVSVAATKGEKTFTGAQLTLKYLFDALDLAYTNNLLFNGYDKAGAVLASPTTLKTACEFGRSITSKL